MLQSSVPVIAIEFSTWHVPILQPPEPPALTPHQQCRLFGPELDCYVTFRNRYTVNVVYCCSVIVSVLH